MPHPFSVTRAIRWKGKTALAPDGRRIGEVDGIIVDRQSGLAQWLLIHTRAHGSRCAPIAGLVGVADRVHVPHDAHLVLAGVAVPRDGALSARAEQQLCGHFQISPTRGAQLSKWERRRTTSLAYLDADGLVRWEPEPRTNANHSHRRLSGVGTDPSSTAHGAGSHTLQILIADPDIAAGHRLSAVITHHPRLRVAGLYHDGPQALNAAHANPPDVIVVAAQMPLLSGVAVHDRLFATDDHLVCVLVDDTADAQPETLDPRTIRIPRTLAPEQTARIIEVLAMTQAEYLGVLHHA